MRKLMFMAAVLALVSSSPPAIAQQTFYVGGWGGFFEQVIRSEVIPEFERKHKVKVEYLVGNSTDTLARLQAQKGNQQLDVALLDDVSMYAAIPLGFCRPINGLPLNELYASARFPEDKAVGFGLLGTGIVYNRDYFEKKGWAAPKSWADLADPKFKKLLVLPPIISTYGLHALLMAAQMNGGNAENIDPGFNYIKTKIAPSVLTFEASQGKFTELFQSGQAVIGVWGSAPMKTFIDSGFPINFVYPTEGAPGQRVAMCSVAKSNDSALADDWIKSLLAPTFQAILAKKYGYGPAIKNAPVTPDEAKLAPMGDVADKLLSFDWGSIAKNRSAWTERWNREIER